MEDAREESICVIKPLKNEKVSVESHVFIGTMYIQYDSKLSVTGGKRNN